MGVKYSASESSQLMEAMANNIQVANEVTDRLSQGCDHLIATLDSGELMGAAYTAGKGLFSEIIIPAIKKLQAAVDDIQTELNSYRIADAQVSEYGNLDLDQLKKTKELREKQLASIKKAIKAKESFLERMKSIATFNIVSYMESLVILSSAESQIESQIKELEEKIEKLEFFVAQVSQYFSDSLEVLRLAIQGATQLSEIIVDSDGNYYADGVDMSWVKKMTEQKIEPHQLDKNIPVTKAEKEKKVIVDDFVNIYGFDIETANLLYQLQQSILEKAETKGWSKERVIYEFNRLVASPVYAGDTGRAAWSGLGGVLKNDKLRKTLKEEYGFSDAEVNLFIRKIEKQQGSSPSKKDLAHEAIQLSTFTEQAWGDRDLSTKEGMKELLAHVLSTLGNSMTIGELPINTERYESSFKGDVDSTRYDDNDFTSDLDAINVYDRISKNGQPDNVFKIQANYNNEIAVNETNRVAEFYKTLGNGDKENGRNFLNYLIENNTAGGQFIKHGKRWDFLWKPDTDEHKKSKEDFYDYLKRGEDKNVGT